MTLKNILTIIKKELRGHFDSPAAYIVLVVFLVLWEFLFFRHAILVGESSLHILFAFLPWLSLLFIPALTMGTISKEKDEGTLELLLTHPLTEKELILGKFLATLFFFWIALLFIFPIAATFAYFGKIDWGIVLGQFLAASFLAATLAALGAWISTHLRSPIAALLVASAAGFFLLLIGSEFITAPLPLFLTPFLEKFSLLSHFQSMARGVIDLRDAWYFFSVTFVFLALAYLALLKQKFGGRRQLYRTQQIFVALLLGVTLFSNVMGSRIPGRIDLTQGRLYSLSQATRDTLQKLESPVIITLFASNELPSPLQPILRDVKDILRDYKTAGRGKVTIAIKNPTGSNDTTKEAAELGVQEVQFNVVSNEEFQLKKGYLGLAVKHGETHESVPFLQDTRDLEYQLTTFIKKLTATEKKKIVFLSGHGEKTPSYEYRKLGAELKKQFTVEELAFHATSSPFPKDMKALVVAGPNEKIDTSAREAITQYLTQGGSALFLIDTFLVNPDGLQLAPNEENFSDFLEAFGVKVASEMVYDLRSNETVRFGGGFITYLLPYPFWPRVVAAQNTSPLTAKISNIVLPWASPVTLNEQAIENLGFQATKIFTTTKTGGTQASATLSIRPDSTPSQTNLGEKLVAATLGKEAARIMVLGDSDFLADQFIENSSNLAFGIEALSWLAEETSLATIQLKQRGGNRLAFENNTQVALTKYGNMALAALLPLAIGAFRLARRKNLRNVSYSSYN